MDSMDVDDIPQKADLKPENFQVLHQIARGSHCDVFEASHSDEPDTLYVAKIYAITGPDTVKKVSREYDASQKIRPHKNIILCSGFKFGSEVQVFMEHGGDDLDEFVKKNNQRLDVMQKLEVMLQMTEGVVHIHKEGYVHRNIKPSNIMVKEVEEAGGRKRLVCRVTDMVLCRESLDRRMEGGTMGIGGENWRAPEMFGDEPGEYRDTVDTFSMGLLFIVLLTTLPRDGMKPLKRE